MYLYIYLFVFSTHMNSCMSLRTFGLFNISLYPSLLCSLDVRVVLREALITRLLYISFNIGPSNCVREVLYLLEIAYH